MSFDQLPDEMKLEIFSYSQNWKELSLVCRLWKDLIEQFHNFDKCLLFVGKRSKQDINIGLSSGRRYKSIHLKFSESYNISLDDVSKFMEDNSTTESAKIKFEYDIRKKNNVLRLLQIFKNVKSLKIITYYGLKIEDASTNSTLPYKNLKNLEVCYRGDHCKMIDIYLSLIECPSIERFVYKSKESRFEDMNFSLKFINKYTLMKLKYFDIACYISQYWLEFLWTGSVLKMAECTNKFIEKEFSEFVKNNCHHFPDLRQLFIYRVNVPETTANLLFSNALNLETISTDWGLPVDGSKHETYSNLKILKLWWLTRPDKIYQLSRCFPNIQKFLIKESIQRDDEELIRSSLTRLTDFRSNMDWNTYHQEYPPNEKLFYF